VVFVGKEACILIRLSRANNNTFILGDAEGIKLKVRTKASHKVKWLRLVEA
jgi:hypothetical protein